MQIQNTNLNFSSRNATIRKADDLARKINKEFPRISDSLIQDYKHAKEFDALLIRLRNKRRQVRNCKMGRFNNAPTYIKKILALIEPVKKERFGNCAESAQIAAIAAKINGIENATVASLRTPSGDRFDHAVLLVRDKNPYVIDPWLGFADYVPNAFEKYRGEYRHHFDFSDKYTDRMTLVASEDDVSWFLRKNTKHTDIKDLKKRIPNLLV